MSESIGELVTHCIRCGFCLEACPTYQITGNEMESPRGRIYLIRSADEGSLRWREDIKDPIDHCLGCRACEPACPSGVEYGAILELARDRIERESVNLPKSLLLESTTNPKVLKAQLTLSQLISAKRIPKFLSQVIAGAMPESDLPIPQTKEALPELTESRLPAVKGEVYFLEGCAMSVLFPRVHQCSKRILRRAGYKVREVRQGCCGALHAHNGHLDKARTLAKELIESMPLDLPVIVDSAGCGSTMKEYGKMLDGNFGSPAFSSRVCDIAEFLDNCGFDEEIKGSRGMVRKVGYHEACHLVHGQRVSSAPKNLLGAIPGIDLVPVNEADMCCGSAGIYNVTQPKMARHLLDRKWVNVEASGAEIVVTGNPGCHSWIAQAGREHGNRVKSLHTAEILEASFIGLEWFTD